MNKLSVLPVLAALACGPSEYQQHAQNSHCFQGFNEFEEVPYWVTVLPSGESVAAPSQGRDSFKLFFNDDENVTQQELEDFYRKFDVALACSLDGEIPSLEEVIYDYSVYATGGDLTNTVYVDFGYLFETADCEVVHVAFLTSSTNTTDCELPLPIYARGDDGSYAYFCGMKYWLDSDGKADRRFVYGC